MLENATSELARQAAMEWPTVRQHIEAGEDQGTAFQRSLGDLSGIGKALCAFGNGDEGGLIVLGVDDSGAIAGVNEDADRVQRRLTDFLETGCSVPVLGQCGRHQEPSGWVHWIDVRRQHRRFEPVHFDGRYWIRRGRSSVQPSPSETQALFHNFGFVLAEGQVIRSATASDIDEAVFRDFLRTLDIDVEGDPPAPVEEDMANAEVLAPPEGRFPTLYGVMAFGRAPQNHPQTSGFFIQCKAYAGTDRGADTVLVADAKGRLTDQVRNACEWYQSLGSQQAYRGPERTDSLVPEQVLREALVNAVAHRDYAIAGPVLLEVFNDRIDVTSPGALPSHVRVQSVRFGRPRTRNESMAHAMGVAGLMKRRGKGWPFMRRAMRDFNGTAPGIVNEENGWFVRVTFHLNPPE